MHNFSSTSSLHPGWSNNGNTTTPMYSPPTTSAAAPEKANLWWWHRVWLPLIIAFSSFLFFRFLQFLVRWYLFAKWTFPTFSYFKIRRFRRSHRSTKDMDSKSLQLVPPNKKWRISNEVVSLFHSGLSGIWALFLLADFQYITDLVYMQKPAAEYLIFMTFGYLAHDFIDLLVNERSARIIELLFHHVVVLSGFMVTHISHMFLYIAVIGLLMEVNSVFLHTRSLMNLYRVAKESTSFKIVALLNLATYILFRLVVSAALICWLFYHYFAGEVAWYMLVINSLLVFALSITNVVLFYRVMAADGLLGERRARASASDGTARSSTRNDHTGGDAHEEEEEPIDDDDEEEEDASDEEAVVSGEPRHAQPMQTAVGRAGANSTGQQHQQNNHQQQGVFVVNVTEH